MFKSIYGDIKQNLTLGNMVTKLIIVNVIIYVFAALFKAFTLGVPSINDFIDKHFGISSNPGIFLVKPWTFITNMFLHFSFTHILFNMIGLNLFGRIVGDLLGDRRILPLYIFGGLLAGIFFIISKINSTESIAYGASGAVMALAMTGALIAPNYNINLLLIGEVKLKYIVFAFIFFDLIGTQTSGSGSSFGHLGGIFGGFLFIYLLNKNIDILLPIENLCNYLGSLSSKKISTPKKSPLKVEYSSLSNLKNKALRQSDQDSEMSNQERIDMILDKIKARGFDKLTKEEKDFLNKMSKK